MGKKLLCTGIVVIIAAVAVAAAIAITSPSANTDTLWNRLQSMDLQQFVEAVKGLPESLSSVKEPSSEVPQTIQQPIRRKDTEANSVLVQMPDISAFIASQIIEPVSQPQIPTQPEVCTDSDLVCNVADEENEKEALEEEEVMDVPCGCGGHDEDWEDVEIPYAPRADPMRQ